MSKQNPPRTMGVEDLIAERMAELRKSRVPVMSYETLATRMGAVGCPIHPSALHRIETGSPRRKVTVDELVALAKVFEVSVDSLIAPAATGAVARVEAALVEYREAMVSLLNARDRLKASEQEVTLAERALDDHANTLSGWRNQLDALARGDKSLDVTLDEAVALEALRKQIVREIGTGTTDMPGKSRRLKVPTTKGWS